MTTNDHETQPITTNMPNVSTPSTVPFTSPTPPSPQFDAIDGIKAKHQAVATNEEVAEAGGALKASRILGWWPGEVW